MEKNLNNDNQNNGSRSEDFNFVQEKVRPQGKRRLKKMLWTACVAFVAAIIFGVTARFAFVLSGGAVNKLLGIEGAESGQQAAQEPERNEVKLPTPGSSSTPSPSPAPTKELSPTVGVSSEASITVEPKDEPTVTPSPDPTDVPVTEIPDNPTATPSDEDGDTEGGEPDEGDFLTGYIKMMQAMKGSADKVASSLVYVRAVTSGINWLDENVESSTELTGVVLGNNGVELLVLTGCEAIVAADRLEIVFPDGTSAEGMLFSKDADLGLSVVAVSLSSIAEGTLNNIEIATLGNSDDICVGEPVMALGRPNGFSGAIEYGFITHTDRTAYYTDGITSLFTTDMNCLESSDGIIVNLSGEIIGIISHVFGDSAGGVSEAISINTIRDVMLRLLNGSSIPYFGIRAENVPSDVLTQMGLENGIYVNEVIGSSPAADAGMHKGDVIVTIDDEPIKSVEEFSRYLMEAKVGSKARVTVYRSSKKEEPEVNILVHIGTK